MHRPILAYKLHTAIVSDGSILPKFTSLNSNMFEIEHSVLTTQTISFSGGHH